MFFTVIVTMTVKILHGDSMVTEGEIGIIHFHRSYISLFVYILLALLTLILLIPVPALVPLQEFPILVPVL
jgi:hypothetical protein